MDKISQIFKTAILKSKIKQVWLSDNSLVIFEKCRDTVLHLNKFFSRQREIFHAPQSASLRARHASGPQTCNIQNILKTRDILFSKHDFRYPNKEI